MHSLQDEEIVADLISDNLSDVPEDIYTESDCASDIEGKIKNVPCGRERETVTVKLAPTKVHRMWEEPIGE
jgi:hypothetical protein